MNIVQQVRDKKDLNEVFSPENYVFDRNALNAVFLKIKDHEGNTKQVTKSQLRKYFNTFKNIDNTIKTNAQISKEEFDDYLKNMMVTYPIMVSKGSFPNELLEVIKHSLMAIYQKNQDDTEKAQAWFQRFVEFYETLIAYSRGK